MRDLQLQGWRTAFLWCPGGQWYGRPLLHCTQAYLVCAGQSLGWLAPVQWVGVKPEDCTEDLIKVIYDGVGTLLNDYILDTGALFGLSFLMAA